MKNKTYVEVSGRKAFDWWEFLNQSEKSSRDWYMADLLSDSWVTCACGSQCDVIPRWEESGQPIDKGLASLGVGFALNIRRKDTAAAKETLKKIEIRSAELIAEINAKNRQSPNAT